MLTYQGYYFHKVGVTKERFGMNADKNDFHMFGGTRLELQDDQIAVIGHKLYDGVDLVVKGSGQSRVAAPKETPGQPEVSLRATSLNDSAI